MRDKMKKILLASQTVSDKKCDSISEFDTIETGMTSYEKKQVESLQSEIMELVAIFSELCEINLIDYSLYGGSLLGSIRHRGFIPWDDDFDIVMTRSNFEKFKIVVESESKLKLSQEKTWLHILRLDEITIDIFIMDYTSSNDKKFKKQVFKNKIIQGMLKKKINFKGKSIFQNT